MATNMNQKLARRLSHLTEKSAIDKPTFKMVAKIHGKFVFGRRVMRLANGIASLIPPGCKTVLDVGSGSGEVAAYLKELAPSLSMTGVDVLVREQTAIPTKSFDGVTLPFPNKSFDVVLLIDVIHHSQKPNELLRDCARVAKRAVIIKDHLQKNRFDHYVLSVMDWAGNASHGVQREDRYFSAQEWADLYQKGSLNLIRTQQRLDLYPFPFSLLIERHLHFMSLLQPQSAID